jgi:quercetin dioxygenase-like cupin family protein
MRVVIFAFAPGQELTEHTSTREALIHMLDGEAVITLGEETRRRACTGTLIRMAPNLPHSVQAQSPVRMLLTMIGK